ncbi:MAG: hypothetical protein AAF593_09320 [Planctomycetota bacterium]
MSVSQLRSRFRRPGQRYGAISVLVGLFILVSPVLATFAILDLPPNHDAFWIESAEWLSSNARTAAFIGIPITVTGLLVMGFTRTTQEKDEAKKQAWKSLRQQIGKF